MSNNRYEGKPLVRLLECYVLKAVGELPESDEKNLTAMQPKLAQVYQQQGTWDQIIAGMMKFPENMPALILKMWEKNREIAKANGVELPPQKFAEMFVDKNLV